MYLTAVAQRDGNGRVAFADVNPTNDDAFKILPTTRTPAAVPSEARA